MASGIFNDIAGGKIVKDGVEHDVLEIKLGTRVIWPVYSYQFEDVQLHWSAGTFFYANGSNYAYATATVKRYRGSVLVDTLVGERLTPSFDSAYFTSRNGEVHASDLGTTETSGYSVTVAFMYGEHVVMSRVLSQEPNVKGSPTIERSVGLVSSAATVPAINASVTATVTLLTSYLYPFTSGADLRETSDAGTAKLYRVQDGSSSLIATDLSSGTDARADFPENQTTSERSFALVATFDGHEDEASKTIFVTQAAGAVTYSEVSFYDYGCDPVPAAGGTADPWAFARQTWGWNGATTGGGEEESAADSYKVVSGTDSAASLGTTEKAETRIGTIRAEIVMNGKYAYVDMDVRQAANYRWVKTGAYDTTTGFYIALSTYQLTCLGGDVTVTGKEVYTHTDTLYTHSSGSDLGGEAHTGLVRDTTAPTITAPEATVSGTTVSIGQRVQNTESTGFNVTGTWGGYSDTQEVVRLGDSYTASTERYDYYAHLTAATGTIGAAGGSTVLEPTAYHSERTRYDWWSGGSTYDTATAVADDYTISGGADYFSRDGLTVSHDNMGKRETTDSVTYTVTNSGDVSKTSSFTISATNTKSSRSEQVNNRITLTSDTLTFPQAGGRADLTTTLFYAIRTYYSWTSGASETVDSEYHSVDVSGSASYSSDQSWLAINGRAAWAERNTGAARGATVTATYGDLVASVGFWQERGVVYVTIYAYKPASADTLYLSSDSGLEIPMQNVRVGVYSDPFLSEIVRTVSLGNITIPIGGSVDTDILIKIPSGFTYYTKVDSATLPDGFVATYPATPNSNR